MELKDRIAEAITGAGKSQRQVAQEAGLSDSALSQLLAGKTKALRAATAVNLSAAVGVSTDWLVTGSDKADLKECPSKETVVFIKLIYNLASMGDGELAGECDIIKGHIPLARDFVNQFIKPSSPELLRFIHAQGDSMEPTFKSGDILLVDSGIKEIKIDGVYVLQAHERLFIKRVRQRLDGQFEVSSDNKNHKTIDVLNGDFPVEVIGRVLWVWNGHKI